MDKNQILIFAAVIAAVAIRLYLKYKNKGKEMPEADAKTSVGTSYSKH